MEDCSTGASVMFFWATISVSHIPAILQLRAFSLAVYPGSMRIASSLSTSEGWMFWLGLQLNVAGPRTRASRANVHKRAKPAP